MFFFARDYRQNYIFFSTQPTQEPPLKISRPRKIWEQAQNKLLLLPPRILSQEQAFIRILKIKEEEVKVSTSGCHSERRIKFRFFIFLQKQRTKHILLLIAETLLLPISGLAAFLPGPNVFFAVLALLMVTHWKALRGIGRLRSKKIVFLPRPLLTQWEEAVAAKGEAHYLRLLGEIETEFGLPNMKKILWK